MVAGGPLALLLRVVDVLDELDIPYALGGSMASSMISEPRTTIDIDIAIRPAAIASDALLENLAKSFYVPVDIARSALASRSSFNVIDVEGGYKVDLFVLGDGTLDRRQIERRVELDLPDLDTSIWVTSSEDQVLRKLDWYRMGGGVSDRQWRDVIGILHAQTTAIDLAYLRSTAGVVGLADLLDAALSDAGSFGA